MEHCHPSSENNSRSDGRKTSCMKLITNNPFVGDPHPLSVVPEEIWLHIFFELKAPQDVESCFRTCAVWRNILMKTRTSFLLPKVLSLLTSNQFLHFDDIIKSCRGVSKLWKQVSDKHLKNTHHHSLLDNLENEVFSLDNFCLDLSCASLHSDHYALFFKRESDLTEITQKVTSFNLPGFNPFVKKYPELFGSFKDNDDENRPEGLPWKFVLNTFLPNYGIHIQHLQLMFVDAPSCEGPVEKFYSTFTSCLKFLPNLHSLKLGVGDRFILEDSLKLQAHLEKNPDGLPQLDFLKMVKFDQVPPPLVVHFLETYKSLEKVQLQTYPNTYFKPIMGGSNVHNIQQLSIVLKIHEELEWLGTLKWPLENLCVFLAFKTISNLGSVFDSLSNFSQTLVKLTINFKCRLSPSQESASNDLRLNLPSLKTLTIIGGNSSFCPNTIDFILPMVSLEELKVARKDGGYKDEQFLYHSEDIPEILFIDEWNLQRREIMETQRLEEKNSESTIKFYDYFERMYESNIWELVSKLKRISVVWRVNGYSRQNIVSGPFFYSRENLQRKE